VHIYLVLDEQSLRHESIERPEPPPPTRPKQVQKFNKGAAVSSFNCSSLTLSSSVDIYILLKFGADEGDSLGVSASFSL
jgi:hypothetical protein